MEGGLDLELLAPFQNSMYSNIAFVQSPCIQSCMQDLYSEEAEHRVDAYGQTHNGSGQTTIDTVLFSWPDDECSWNKCLGV